MLSIHSSHVLFNLTTEQVRSIFSSECINWSELGGANEPIRAYQRGIGSGSQALMDKLVMKELPMADTATIKAIGDMGGLIEPNYSTIKSGEYPFVSEFCSVIRKNEPQDSPARKLHEWMLTPEAQNLMVSENYVALFADPSADTPHVDSEFSFYPDGV